VIQTGVMTTVAPFPGGGRGRGGGRSSRGGAAATPSVGRGGRGRGAGRDSDAGVTSAAVISVPPARTPMVAALPGIASAASGTFELNPLLALAKSSAAAAEAEQAAVSPIGLPVVKDERLEAEWHVQGGRLFVQPSLTTNVMPLATEGAGAAQYVKFTEPGKMYQTVGGRRLW
jgi:hypothetical protein